VTAIGMSGVVKTAARQVFDHIVGVLGISLAVSAALVPPLFFLPIGLAVVYLALFGVPLFGWGIFVSKQVVEKRRWEWKEMAVFVRHLPGLFGLGLLYSLMGLILYASWWYHFSTGSGAFSLSLVIALFQTYFVGLFFLSQLYALDEMFSGQGPWYRCVLTSMQMVLRRPGYAMGLFLQLFSVALLLLFTVVGFFFLFPGILGVVLTVAARAVRGDSGK
jgi:hypothetical protein